MATKRRGSGKRSERKSTATRRRSGARPSSPRGAARAGTREARPEQAAHQVQVELERTPEVRASHLRAVEPAPEVELAERTGGPAAASEGSDAQRRAQAEAELGRRREAAGRLRSAEAGAASHGDAEGLLPGLSAIGVELALGALRLARTVATAPLRVGLALLRSRDA